MAAMSSDKKHLGRVILELAKVTQERDVLRENLKGFEDKKREWDRERRDLERNLKENSESQEETWKQKLAVCEEQLAASLETAEEESTALRTENDRLRAKLEQSLKFLQIYQARLNDIAQAEEARLGVVHTPIGVQTDDVPTWNSYAQCDEIDFRHSVVQTDEVSTHSIGVTADLPLESPLPHQPQPLSAAPHPPKPLAVPTSSSRRSATPTRTALNLPPLPGSGAGSFRSGETLGMQLEVARSRRRGWKSAENVVVRDVSVRQSFPPADRNTQVGAMSTAEAEEGGRRGGGKSEYPPPPPPLTRTSLLLHNDNESRPEHSSVGIPSTHSTPQRSIVSNNSSRLSRRSDAPRAVYSSWQGFVSTSAGGSAASTPQRNRIDTTPNRGVDAGAMEVDANGRLVDAGMYRFDANGQRVDVSVPMPSVSDVLRDGLKSVVSSVNSTPTRPGGVDDRYRQKDEEVVHRSGASAQPQRRNAYESGEEDVSQRRSASVSSSRFALSLLDLVDDLETNTVEGIEYTPPKPASRRHRHSSQRRSATATTNAAPTIGSAFVSPGSRALIDRSFGDQQEAQVRQLSSHHHRDQQRMGRPPRGLHTRERRQRQAPRSAAYDDSNDLNRLAEAMNNLEAELSSPPLATRRMRIYPGPSEYTPTALLEETAETLASFAVSSSTSSLDS